MAIRRRVGWWAPAVLLAVVLFLVVVRTHPGGARSGRAVDDVGQLLAAAAAALACGWRARRAGARAGLAGLPQMMGTRVSC